MKTLHIEVPDKLAQDSRLSSKQGGLVMKQTLCAWRYGNLYVVIALNSWNDSSTRILLGLSSRNEQQTEACCLQSGGSAQSFSTVLTLGVCNSACRGALGLGLATLINV